jgi:DNA-binding CsgD family transcriptional regulator
LTICSRGGSATCVAAAELLAFGASACLRQDTQGRDVLNAVHLASRGLQLVPLSARSSGEAVAGAQLLTRREAEVLPLLQQGRSNAQIALALHVGVETVRTHARNIYRKLGVASRRDLAAPRVPTREPPPVTSARQPRRLAARPRRPCAPRTRRTPRLRRRSPLDVQMSGATAANAGPAKRRLHKQADKAGEPFPFYRGASAAARRRR